MPISTECPSCKGRVRLPDNAAGKRYRCPKCKGVIFGPGAEPPPTIRPKETLDPGFVDAPESPNERSPFDEHVPISSAVKKATFEDFNPFDDGARSDEEDENPKKRRYYQPKDDYNPFTDPSAAAPAEPGANPEVLFDFGAEEPPPATDPSEDLNFGSSGGESPRRRR